MSLKLSKIYTTNLPVSETIKIINSNRDKILESIRNKAILKIILQKEPSNIGIQNPSYFDVNTFFIKLEYWYNQYMQNTFYNVWEDEQNVGINSIKGKTYLHINTCPFLTIKLIKLLEATPFLFDEELSIEELKLNETQFELRKQFCYKYFSESIKQNFLHIKLANKNEGLYYLKYCVQTKNQDIFNPELIKLYIMTFCVSNEIKIDKYEVMNTSITKTIKTFYNDNT